MENWKAVVGYDGLYEVSDMGRVRSLGRPHKPGVRSFAPRILKTPVNRKGYPEFNLVRDGKQKLTSLHRAVALAFLGTQPKDTVIDHINNIKTDARPENLRYISQSLNVLNSCRRFSHGDSSLPRGVIRTPRYKKKFGAHIKVNGAKKWLGTFDTIEDARAAYIEANRLAFAEAIL